MSAKITYANNSYLTPAALNGYWGTSASTGHAHDQGSDATSAPYVNLQSHVTGRVQPLHMNLPGYIQGLTLNMGSVLSNSLSIATGTCSVTNAALTESLLVTAPAGTKLLAQAWVAGTGNAGLPAACTLTNESWYHVFLLVGADGVTCDWGFDQNITATNLMALAGNSYYRRIGSIFWTLAGTNHITPFLQVGDMFLLDRKVGIDTGMHMNSVTASDTNEHNLTFERCPTGLPFTVYANMDIGLNGTPAKYVKFANGYDTVAEADLTFNIQYDTSSIHSNNPAGYWNHYQMVLTTNSSAQVRFQLSDAVYTAISASISKYIDTRGKI